MGINNLYYFLIMNREVRRLTIPSGLAYGETGAGTMIPPNATVVYDLELVDILPPKNNP